MLKQIAFSLFLYLPVFAALVSAQTAYAISDDLILVSQLENGYTEEQALKFRRVYSPLNFVLNDDINTFLPTHMFEIPPAAVFLRDGAISTLDSNPMLICICLARPP